MQDLQTILKTMISRIETESVREALAEVGVVEYDNLSDVLEGLSQQWDALSEIEREQIAVTIAGRYGVARFINMVESSVEL